MYAVSIYCGIAGVRRNAASSSTSNTRKYISLAHRTLQTACRLVYLTFNSRSDPSKSIKNWHLSCHVSIQRVCSHAYFAIEVTADKALFYFKKILSRPLVHSQTCFGKSNQSTAQPVCNTSCGTITKPLSPGYPEKEKFVGCM